MPVRPGNRRGTLYNLNVHLAFPCIRRAGFAAPALVPSHGGAVVSPGTGLRRVWEGVRITVRDGNEKIGTLFMTHGHQGTLGSDRFKFLSRWALQFYRFMQHRFGVTWFGGVDLPSQDNSLRGEHDLIMYKLG